MVEQYLNTLREIEKLKNYIHRMDSALKKIKYFCN